MKSSFARTFPLSLAVLVAALVLVPAARPDVWDKKTEVKFSIVTPSFRNSSWLKLCIASVADQEGIEFEHIVQDAGSDDGTLDWLPQDKRVKAFIEKDGGMYDAVNRGYRRAQGELLAYLNCDEQYLPGALKVVHDFFERHPEIEVALAGAIVIGPRIGKFNKDGSPNPIPGHHIPMAITGTPSFDREAP